MTTLISDPVIEPPVEADISELVRLLEEDLGSLDIYPNVEELRTTIHRLVHASQETSYVRVIREEEGAPPTGVLVAHRWHSITFAGPSFWLESLYVDPTIRRRGYGRMLVEALLQFARETGIRGIDLEAYRMNAPAAYLYRSLGFRRLGRERYTLTMD